MSTWRIGEIKEEQRGSSCELTWSAPGKAARDRLARMPTTLIRHDSALLFLISPIRQVSTSSLKPGNQRGLQIEARQVAPRIAEDQENYGANCSDPKAMPAEVTPRVVQPLGGARAVRERLGDSALRAAHISKSTNVETAKAMNKKKKLPETPYRRV